MTCARTSDPDSSHPVALRNWLILLVAGTALSCTSPDFGSTGDELLNLLLEEVPTLSGPLQTPENEDDFCFQQARDNAEAVTAQARYFTRFFGEIRSEWTGPVSAEHGFEWSYLDEDGLSTATFRITPGDSIHIAVSYDGPAFEDRYDITGWIQPELHRGKIEYPYPVAAGLSWAMHPEGIMCSTPGANTSTALMDSVEGGGSVMVDDLMLNAIIFGAGWDGTGHGWCGSPVSGGW